MYFANYKNIEINLQMNNSIKFLLVSVFTLCISITYAQFPGGGGRAPGGQNMNMGHFYGKIVDSINGKPLEAASVLLIQNKFDTVTKKRNDVVVAGMLTDKKGDFTLENLNVMAQYKLKITAIGFKAFEEKVAFALNMNGGKPDMSAMLNAVDRDLGNISLKPDLQQLENVTVTTSKALFTMNIDRKVFNVEKNLTSVGGTAVDVMKNIPSVSVDIDGNVSLRNASPQIFIDGRPSTLTLDQIPADEIASVEIITNPSAKFDASGGGAGILNIVMKKNRKAGYNGNINASIDSRGKPGFGGDINVKQGKINFFARARVNTRKSISTSLSDRTDFLRNDTTSNFTQNSKPLSNGYFAFLRGGFDYFIDNRNTITIGGTYVTGQFKNSDLINIDRDTLYKNNLLLSDYGYRNTNSAFKFRNVGTNVSFKHNFAKPNKELTVDVNYNQSKNDNSSDNNTQYFYPNGSIKTQNILQTSDGGGTTKYFTVQTDFANPISENLKLEMGARGAVRNYKSTTANFSQDTTGKLVPIFGNNYEFTDQVYAAYATFSQKIKKFTYQLGLRVESSSYTGTLIGSTTTFKNDYPFSLFPSLFMTYKLSDKADLQVNYSRKINRPNFFQLIPNYDFSDPLNLSIGNPNLIPEFTNLAEISYQNQVTKKTSFLATAYLRNTNNLITSYQYKDKNPDTTSAPKPDSVIITTFANASKSYNIGLELTLKTKPAKFWDFTINVNVYNSTLQAGLLAGGTTNNQLSMFGKINNSFTLPKNYSIQLSGDYQAKTIIPPSSGGGMGRMFGGSQVGAQGYIKPNYGVDIAIKKDFMKNKAASLSLSMNDIFRTKLYGTYSESQYFVQDNQRRRDPQVLRLSFNYRFGKVDVSLFKKKSMKGEMDSMQNASQGMGN